MAGIPPPAAWQAALRQRHGASLQKKLAAAVVAVCGLGGLGSHIASSLARAGIGKLVLVDFDTVDITNLHRQQYKAAQIGLPKVAALADNLREIAPYTEIAGHNCRLTAENFRPLLAPADIICEAFDEPAAKAMLANAVLTAFPEKYLVAASGVAGLGAANDIKTRQIASRFILCGDETSAATAGQGLFAPRVMLAAAHQALAVVRLIAGHQP